MNKRLNIILPEETVRLLDRVAGKGQRSRFIHLSVTRLAAQQGRRSLRKQLAEGARARAERDRRLAQEWLALDFTDEPTERQR